MIRPRGLHLATIIRLLAPRRLPEPPIFVFLCVADHYEPMNGGAPPATQTERVTRWINEYPQSISRLADSRGRPPQHTFFYPVESYLAEDHSVQHVERLANLCKAGFGDIEVHLHHDNDTSENLAKTLTTATRLLHERHGLLAKDAHNRLTYGFIHGNWALDNARPDGRWCGVNDELSVLRETGCYADFTMPSAPSTTQTKIVNSIYYARDNPQRPKSHDAGIPAQVGRLPPDEGLLMIQGPLQLDWNRRRLGLLPGIENADLHGQRPPDEHRLQLWLNAGVGVIGRPNWIFIKLHTHGAIERNAAMLLGEPMRSFHNRLAERAAAQPGFFYYYVTARELAQLVHQAEAGATQPTLEAPSPQKTPARRKNPPPSHVTGGNADFEAPQH
jgi:hypothetical protein